MQPFALYGRSFEEQSLFFARVSAIAYKAPIVAGPLFLGMGFKSTFISVKGSECYVLTNANDMIIACRGTQPKQWKDIAADLSIDRIAPRYGDGKVHTGFQHYVDKIWNKVFEVEPVGNRQLWLTGHSLGAGMATLIARAYVDFTVDSSIRMKPVLFTYGSPRVGNKAYINEFNQHVTHHRWVNDGDFVTKVPLVPFFYHSGTRHHLSDKGVVSGVMVAIKLVTAFVPTLIAKIYGDMTDHSIDKYIQHLSVSVPYSIPSSA